MNIKENYFKQRNLTLKKENRVIAAKRQIERFICYWKNETRT